MEGEVIKTTALLCIDTASLNVRRYDRVFDRVRCTGEFEIPRPQPSPTVLYPMLEETRKNMGAMEGAFA